MKWLFLLILSALSANRAFCAFISIENSRPVFTGYCASCTITAPQDYEVNLSTCLVVVIDGKLELGFDNYSDWLDCQTKAGLRRKYRKLQAIIDSFGVLPAALTSDLRERAGWLRSYYLSLP